MAMRISESEGNPAREKVMKLETFGVKKAERMFLTIDPPLDKKEGEWATQCKEDFDKALSRYLGLGSGYPRSPDGSDSGQGEGE